MTLCGVALAACLATPSLAQKVYVAFGDSITAGTGDSTQNAANPGYPPRLQALLAARGITATVRNAGLPGEDTTGALTRINNVLNGGGDTLLLMEGTNDIIERISLETTMFDLNQIAIKAINRGLTVVHAPVIPRLPTANTDGDNKEATAMAFAIRDLAWKNGRGLADPFEVFLYTPNVFNLYYGGGVDKLHPNAAGYDRMAEVFRDVLVNLDTVPPVPGAFSPADGATDVPATGPITATLYDFGQGIDTGSVKLLLNGEAVAAQASPDGKKLSLAYTPATPLKGVFTLSVQAADLNIPANSFTHVLGQFITVGTTFLPGDIDRSGRVDGTDLVLFAIGFGARKGDRRYVARLDINNDGLIDGLDLAILAANFGRSSF